MTTLQWSLLNSSSFEALVHTIIFYQDPKAFLFNRPGKDGAQDAKSGDSKTVYQAKFHSTNLQNASSAFSDAKKEFEAIKKYKSNNDSRWINVKNWTLISPVNFGSQDHEKWDKEIVPLFKKINLRAEIWPSRTLELKITQCPELKEAFFEGSNRCFLSLPEFRGALLDDRLGAPGLKVDYIGHNKELDIACSFLKDPKKKLQPVIGKAGTGKTRFLLECGYKSVFEKSVHQVLWAQTHTLASSEHWFKAIPTHISTLVLIDSLDTFEFRDAQKFLQTFKEQILISQSNWKAIIVVPSSEWLDEAINLVRSTSNSNPIEIKNLKKSDATKMAQEILTIQRPDIKGPLQEKISEDIATHSDGTPLWIVAETCIISENGNLIKSIKDPFGIASGYLKNCLKNFKETEIEDILFWVSMYQPVQKTDQNFLRFISKKTKISIEKIENILNKAEEQKIIHSYGVSKRYIKIVPQGLADNIVYRQLLTRAEQPSSKALEFFEDLIKDHEKIFEPQKILHAIGKMGFHNEAFRNTLKKFSDKLIKNIRTTKNVSFLKKYFDLAKPLAIYIPDHYLKIISQFRQKEKVPNRILKVKYLSPYTLTFKKEVQAHLARAVYDISSFARDDNSKKNLLNEMIQLCEKEFDWFEEQEIERRNNEDKGGLRKLSDIIFMGAPYLQEYQVVARELALKYLQKIEDNKLNQNEIKIIESIISPQIKVERRVTYFLDDKITWITGSINGFIAETRKIIVTKLRALLKNTNKTSLSLVLKLLSKAHNEANSASLGRWLNPPSKKTKEEFQKEIIENLHLILELLPNLSINEKELAHQFWDWHLKFDKRKKLKDIARKCEEKRQRSLGDLDLSIFSYNYFDRPSPENLDEEISDLAKKLVEKDADEIFNYFEQALTLESANHSGQYITQLARTIGEKYFKSKSIQKYFIRSISSKKIDGKNYGHFQISITAIGAQCAIIRNDTKAKIPLLKKIIDSFSKIITSPEIKMIFFYNLYQDRFGSNLIQQDLEIILSIKEIFLKKKAWAKIFYLFGKIFDLNPKSISKEVNVLWPRVPLDIGQSVYESFLEGLSTTSIDLAKYKLWLFGQTLWVNDPDHLERAFRFMHIFRDWKLSLSDFYQLILKRLKMKPKGKKSDYKILPDDGFLNWIQKIEKNDDPKSFEAIIKKFLNLETDKNWEIKYYLPKVLPRLDPHGIVLPSIISKKIESLKSIEAIRNWVRYAANYTEKSQSWMIIASPALKFIKNMEEDSRNSIYSIICKDAVSPMGWVGNASDAWNTRLSQAQDELKNEQDEQLHGYLQWKIDYLNHQKQHFVEWEEED